MAQDFAMRYPLITGQGNFGSVDGDPPAAMRYTEVKLAPISAEMLADIERETIDFIDNFDQTLKDPVFLPAKIPNLLLMGAEGIAVGMATKIPPHNLGEVIEATIHLIQKGKMGEPHEIRGEAQMEFRKISFEESKAAGGKLEEEKPLRFESSSTIEDLMQFIKGPDFPTAGSIFDQNEIKEAYATGKGRIVIRGKAEIEETKGGKYQIIISEIPYQVNKAHLVAKIADLAKERKIDGISDLRDESDRQGVRVAVELKRDAKPKSVLNNLFKKTELQTTFPANFVALVDGTPMTLNLKQILTEYVNHRHLVITRRSKFELKEAKARGHILEGLLIALDHLDEVIETIKKSADADEAKVNLMTKFKLTEIQSVAILDMQLRRLAALERKKIEDEYKIIQDTIAYLLDLLAHPEKILKVITEELTEIKAKYADERRTKIFKKKAEEFSEEDLIPNEEEIIIVTATGYIKRANRAAYRTQKRGGKGIVGITPREEDAVGHFLCCSTHDDILFFTGRGRVFQAKAYEIPEASRTARGQAIVNILSLEAKEAITAVVPVREKKEAKYLFMATKNGIIKRTKIEEFSNVRRNGLIAINLKKDDRLKWARLTSGQSQIVLITAKGQSIRFNEKDARSMGRTAAGVKGIQLKAGDEAVKMDVISAEGQKPKSGYKLLVLTENGFGKRTEIGYYKTQKRGGMGIKTAKLTSKTGDIVDGWVLTGQEEDLIVISRKGQVIRTKIKDISILSRATQGVRIMKMKQGDKAASITCV